MTETLHTYYVYYIGHYSTDKCYIGITRTGLHDRFRRHRYDALAYRKYGYTRCTLSRHLFNFDDETDPAYIEPLEILENVTHKYALQREREIINFNAVRCVNYKPVDSYRYWVS